LTHARVYTTYGIQRHVKNQKSVPRIDDGAEEVGNLNCSVRGEGRNLNVLRRWRIKEDSYLLAYFAYLDGSATVCPWLVKSV